MYFITMLNDISSIKNLTNTHTVGYYSNYENCVSDLHSNILDIRESEYNYAIVENIKEGIFSPSLDRTFFKWDDSKKGFFEIEEPESVKHLCNFAIG